jgi:hypothetical protein
MGNITQQFSMILAYTSMRMYELPMPKALGSMCNIA